MKSIIIFLSTCLWAYAIEIFLVGAFLAFLIQKRKKTFSWIKIIPILIIFFALNEAIYLPAVINGDVTFTIHNQELAELLEVAENESLTNFVFTDFFSFWGWFVEAWLAFGVSLFLTRKTANPSLKGTGTFPR